MIPIYLKPREELLYRDKIDVLAKQRDVKNRSAYLKLIIDTQWAAYVEEKQAEHPNIPKAMLERVLLYGEN